jgi:hypothetical protein
MIEQLNLFSEPDQEPEPQQKPPGNPYDDTFWKPKTFYRYNENGRPSGWVRITREYIAWVNMDKIKHRLYAAYIRNRYSTAWGWITPEDLEMYFERIAKPEWLNDD